MGSFIARDYISKYGEELDGVTLCGTMGVWPDFEDAKNYIDKIVESGKTKESDPDIPKKPIVSMFRYRTTMIS
ncbi:hypothetical protein BXO88_15940 [Oribacterium sp. C9]|uniref:hypothetical protein n=1 Tax=Oribacterium sp. C9 TaxID=1943579 RepID=UPI00098F6063|nr:hypothetical protein [Oribacterium sp. C9]OON84710.1 hypothetical protein BXO88_15940 [Oribacterium sp. C9]